MDTNDPESEYATIEPYTTITYMDLAQRRDNELPYNHLTVRRKDNAKIGSSQMRNHGDGSENEKKAYDVCDLGGDINDGYIEPVNARINPIDGYLGDSVNDGYIEPDTARRNPENGHLGDSVNDGYIDPDTARRIPVDGYLGGSVTDVFTEPVTARRDPVDGYLKFF